MAKSKSRSSLPPGFRFHPTDIELVLYYLKRKLLGKPLRFDAIAELDLYKYSPWDLPEKSYLRTRDLEWFFFCPRDRKYNNGPRTNRATENGYWKTTGRDRPICNDSHTIGTKKTLIFHLGRAPLGERTNWVMHEYKIEDKDLLDKSISLDAYVLCKIFEKSGAGPKNGEQHGAPFNEDDWEEDLVDNALVPLLLADTGSAPSLTVGGNQNTKAENSMPNLPNKSGSSLEPPCLDASSDTGFAPSLSVGGNQNTITENSMTDLPNTHRPSLEPPHRDAASSSAPIVGNPPLAEDFDIETLLACFGDVDELRDDTNGRQKELDLLRRQSKVESPVRMDGNDIFGGLEDICSGAELKATDTSYSPNMWEKYVLDQSLLGGDVNYLELKDLDGSMGYPMRGTEGMQIEFDNFGPWSELEAVDKLWLPDNPDTRDNISTMDDPDQRPIKAKGKGKMASEDPSNGVLPAYRDMIENGSIAAWGYKSVGQNLATADGLVRKTHAQASKAPTSGSFCNT